GPADIELYVAADGPTQQRQRLQERPDTGLPDRIVGGSRHQHADPPHSLRLLRPCCKRPCRRAAEQRDELAAPHSITSSATNRMSRLIVSPTSLAAFTLMTSSNLVGRSTGKSAGFAPLSILSTYVAVRRNRSSRFAPYDMRPPASTNSRA